MKKLNILAAVSAIALLAASPALATVSTQDGAQGGTAYTAPNANNPDTPDMPTVTKQDIKKGWDKTKQAVKDTVKQIKAAMLNNDPSVKSAPVNIAENRTAAGMIGQPLYNDQHQKVATVHDVILDNAGNASLIVVKDGGFAGIGGKLGALDYNAVTSRDDKGDTMQPVSAKTLKSVEPFTYDATATAKGAKTLPAGGYSLAKLMEGAVLDDSGRKLANIDNVSLRSGRADLVIASYGQVLSMGGDKVAINFDTSQIVRDKDSLSMKLTTAQTQQFHAIEMKTN
ncbi:MAG: hypothetical protein GC185_10425 [Alphaproteobacteria bacterium]|nr:hypothetical protein [Alphaproteobacteria bacterium]